jgi:hypothetical protein
VKVTKQRFKSHFYDLMAELAADEEILVQIEGIDLITEYLMVVKKSKIVEDFIPIVEKMLNLALDNTTADEVRIKMTKLSGKILDKLAQHSLAASYDNLFMDFFN